MRSNPNILIIEPPAVSRFGNQRIFGGNGSNKSDFRKPPLDLMMISGYLRKEGFDNALMDCNASRRVLSDVDQEIRALKPDIVFFSTSTCTIHKDLLVAKTAKAINPSCVTVAIGTHVMALPEETFKASGYVDVLVNSGEWEQAALNIVRNISNLEAAKGIYCRKVTGEIARTERQPPLTNLDDLGFPAHDKLQKEIYRDPTTKRFPKTMVMGQKACVNNCSFCCQPAFFGAPVIRKRSIPHFIEELKWVRHLGFREVMFNDATLTADLNWATSLFEKMIKNHIDLSWNCSTRADRATPDVLRLMKRAGCHTIAFGLESTDPLVLQNIRKNVSLDQIRKVVTLAKKEGLDAIVFCVIGFPGETKESIKKTISFLKSLDTKYITLGIAVPVPGTDFYTYIEDHGYLQTKDWSLFDPLKKPVFSYPWLSADEIAHYSAYGLRQFYLRPTYILNALLSIKNLDTLETYLKNFVGFINRYVLRKKA